MRALLPLLPLSIALFAAGCQCHDGDNTDDTVDTTDTTDTMDTTDTTPVDTDLPGADADALATLRDASATPVRIHTESGVPDTLELDVALPGDPTVDPVDSVLTLLETYKDLLRIDDPRNELRPDAGPDGTGLPTWSWRQHKGGVEILGSSLKVVVIDGRARVLHGKWIPELTDQPTSLVPDVASHEAVAAVRGRAEHVIGLPALRLVHGDLTPGAPAGLKLVWQVHLSGQGDRELLVDAHDGSLLLETPMDRAEYPAQDYEVRWLNQAGSTGLGQGTLWFTESGPSNGYSAGNDGDGEGSLGNTHVTGLNDWYYDVFGRSGYTGMGASFFGALAFMEVHADLFYRDTNGNPAPNAYGNGANGLIQFHDGLLTIDVIGHEYAHTWEYWESRLTYANQSGALAESVADVFGVLYAQTHGDPDWLLGDGSVIGVIRDFSNPPAYGQPDHVQASLSGDGTGVRPNVGSPGATNDNGWVHTNSGIPNKAAYLLINGGTHGGVSVRPLGATALGKLMYVAVSSTMGSSETLSSWASDMVAVATLLDDPPLGLDFGYNPTLGNACDVAKAYYAVGMWTGPIDSDCDGTPDSSETDNDGDLVPDASDNCPNVSNPTQANMDGDTLGDTCDPDRDGDGALNAVDNCQYRSNANQADWNDDNQGDVCDDSDQDGTVDASDNCRDLANYEQQNTDGDSKGDACDTDDDGDGILDVDDVCPTDATASQDDGDGDGVGDDCDNCPQDENSDQRDCNGNGVGNACDPEFSLCPEDFDRLSRGRISKDSIIPIPKGCLSCPFELGLDWMENVTLPLELAGPGYVIVDVVREDGSVVVRGTVADGALEVPVGIGYDYRAPGTQTYFGFEQYGLKVSGDFAESVVVGVAVH